MWSTRAIFPLPGDTSFAISAAFASESPAPPLPGLGLSGGTNLPKVILPVPPLQEVMNDLRKNNVDFIVLLADSPRGEIDAIIQKVPGIDLVISAQDFNLSETYTSQMAGTTRILNIGDQGKRLGWIRMDFQPDGKLLSDEEGLIALDNSVPTLSSVSTLLAQMKVELRSERDQFMGDPGNPFQNGSASPEFVDTLTGFAGESWCKGCHVRSMMDQQVVGYEMAWTKLSENDRTNAECLACHTTGYGIPTGLQDPFKDSHLQGVTCEACHGPGADHVRTEIAKQKGLDMSDFMPSENPTGLQFTKQVAEAVCVKCHTPQWSPNFDYATWVLKVNHSTIDQNKPVMVDQGEATPAPESPEEGQGSTGE